MNSSSRSTKVLAPLAVLLAAGALAVGSGATFTSTTSNTISSVTAGSLTQANSKAGEAIFDLADMKPGDTLNGTLSITNTGTLPANFSLTEVRSANAFAENNLTLTITNTTTDVELYNGVFGGLEDGVKKELGTVGAGVQNDYRFTVKLAQTADNTQQGLGASATYTWDSVQVDGATITDQ